jgi:hypothetical protein
MPPVKLKAGCSRKAHKDGLCNNFQAIMFTKNGVKQKLFFNSVKEREEYYKKHLKGKEGCEKFVRYSVMSTNAKKNTRKKK